MPNKFRSFSRQKRTALGFLDGDANRYKTALLYELRTRKKLFKFDTSVDNIFLDQEDEVILFSNMRFKVIDMKEVTTDFLKYIHVRMLNVDEMIYEAYYDRAQHMRPFNTTAPMPKPPSKSQKSSELDR